MKNRSTTDALLALRHIVDSSTAKYILGILFDYKAAFDSVLHAQVLHCYKQAGIPRNLYAVKKSYFEGRTVSLTWSDQRVTRQAGRGCPQGSVLGPSDWNISFDPLLQNLQTSGHKFLAYADDLVVFIEANSRRDIESRGQTVTNQIITWSRDRKLEISKKKTEGIYLKSDSDTVAPLAKWNHRRPDARQYRPHKPKTASRNPVIKIEGSSIPIKKKVRYLGIVIDEGTSFGSHCKYLRDKMKPLSQGLARVAKESWGLNMNTVLSLYSTVFLPTVTYAAEAWADKLNVHHRRTLASAQRISLISATRSYRTAPADALCVVAGTLPIDILLQKRVALNELRNGRAGRIGDILIAPNTPDVKSVIEESALDLWQSRWNSSSKGRTTYKFLKDVRARMNAAWLKPGFYTTQVITGHGDFQARLCSLGLSTHDTCACGALDTAEHLLFDCPLNTQLRNTLMEEFNLGWPKDPSIFTSSREFFQLFSRFCREALQERTSQRSLTSSTPSTSTSSCPENQTVSTQDTDSSD